LDDKLVDKIAFIVEEACKSRNNKFGYGIWTHHIKPMISIGQELAIAYKANIETVTIAILLHDFAGINDEKKRDDHHIYGAEEAEFISKSLSYPDNKSKQFEDA